MHVHPRSELDVIGATLSVACALHCLAAPLLVSAVPYLFGEQVELLLGVVLFGIASLAMLRGVRQHRDVRVLVPFAVGIALFFSPRGEEGSARDVALAVASSAGLVTAHLLNLRALALRCC